MHYGSNGQTIPLAEITLATFNGQNALQALNGGADAATVDSGPPIYGATGTVAGSSLEASNVDIATQLHGVGRDGTSSDSVRGLLPKRRVGNQILEIGVGLFVTGRLRVGDVARNILQRE